MTDQELMANQEQRMLAMLSHLLGFFTSVLGPLVIYLVKREEKFVAFHALQALFFQLALIVAYSISGVLVLVLVGILLVIGIAVGSLVLVIIACIKSFNGEWYEYPLIGAWVRRTFAL